MLNDFLDPYAECFDSTWLRRWNEVGTSPRFRDRLSVLAGKANEGMLSDAERSEYDAAINAADIISMLKLMAQQHVAASQNS